MWNIQTVQQQLKAAIQNTLTEMEKFDFIYSGFGYEHIKIPAAFKYMVWIVNKKHDSALTTIVGLSPFVLK